MMGEICECGAIPSDGEGHAGNCRQVMKMEPDDVSNVTEIAPFPKGEVLVSGELWVYQPVANLSDYRRGVAEERQRCANIVNPDLVNWAEEGGFDTAMYELQKGLLEEICYPVQDQTDLGASDDRPGEPMNDPMALVYCEHCPNHAVGSISELRAAGWYLTHDLGITICKNCDQTLTDQDASLAVV